MRKRQICNNNIFRGANIFVVPNNLPGGRFEGILQIYKSFPPASEASPDTTIQHLLPLCLGLLPMHFDKSYPSFFIFYYCHFIILSAPVQWLQCIPMLIFFINLFSRAKWRKKSNIVGRQLDINFSRPMKIVRREDIVAAAAREIYFASSFERAQVFQFLKVVSFHKSSTSSPMVWTVLFVLTNWTRWMYFYTIIKQIAYFLGKFSEQQSRSQ